MAKKYKKRSYSGIFGKKGSLAVDGEGAEREVTREMVERIEPQIIEIKTNINKGDKGSSLLSIFVAILIVAGLIWFFFYTATGENITAGFLDMPVWDRAKIFISSLYSTLQPGGGIGSWKNPDPVNIDEVEDKGVIIKNLIAGRPYYTLNNAMQDNEFITANAEADIKNLEVESDIKFSCYLEFNGKTKTKIAGEIKVSPGGEGYEEVSILKGLEPKSDKKYAVSCRLHKNEVKADSIEKDMESFSGNLVVKAVYDTTTRAVLRVYTTSKELSENELSNFQAGLRGGGLLFNDRLKSQTRFGAMDGFLDLKISQPITQVNSYPFSIGLKNTKGWKGELEEFKGINLKAGDGMAMSDENCDDLKNGDVKEELKNIINNKNCRAEEVDPIECAQKIDINNLLFNCELRIDGISEQEQPSYSLVTVDFDYSYAVVSKANIVFKVVKDIKKP